MEIEQVAELARAVAGLPQDQRDYFEGMIADERAKAAEAERIAKLRAMSDEEVVRKALVECTEYAQHHNEHDALQTLRDAGFVRKAPLAAPAFQDGATYERGDRVQVRGVVYECLHDGVTAFFYVSGGRGERSVRATTPHWRVVGASS